MVVIVVSPEKYNEEDLIIYHNHLELWLSNPIGGHSEKVPSKNQAYSDCRFSFS